MTPRMCGNVREREREREREGDTQGVGKCVDAIEYDTQEVWKCE